MSDLTGAKAVDPRASIVMIRRHEIQSITSPPKTGIMAEHASRNSAAGMSPAGIVVKLYRTPVKKDMEDNTIADTFEMFYAIMCIFVCGRHCVALAAKAAAITN
jgi:hypothetical protein